jgi:hypothetical protein
MYVYLAAQNKTVLQIGHLSQAQTLRFLKRILLLEKDSRFYFEKTRSTRTYIVMHPNPPSAAETGMARVTLRIYATLSARAPIFIFISMPTFLHPLIKVS